MVRCKYCGQAVLGEYVTALGETWHPEHFLCAACGKPLRGGKFQVVQGKPYHPECYLTYQAPRCSYCGAAIAESYIEYEGKYYHSRCYYDHVVPRCVYCHKSLLGRYLVDAWGNKFHTQHQQEYPSCSFCGRLIPPQQQMPGWQFNENQRCPVCRSTAIESAEQAQPLFSQLKSWIGQQGFRFNQLPLRLELCDRSRLEYLLQGRSTVHPLGVTLSSTQMQNGRVLSSRVEGVAVLQGMPATLFAGVVLHELGHVWLTVHRIESLPLWAEEGFCQLLSYRYYVSLDTPEARYRAASIERETDATYGEGFRRMRALAERLGFERLVERLLVAKALPGV